MKVFLAVIGFLVVFLLSTVWYGYVLSILWTWFITPAFHVATLSIPLAIGVAMVARTFISPYPDASDSTRKKDVSLATTLTTSTVISFLSPLIALAMGWLIHLFI